ncbi:MAG TPA: hypothetical protein VIO32_05115 [Candidatus Baltobacteraceae bacterium]
MILLLTALISTSAPLPSPSVSPPTIVHETVYPICSALHTNIGNSIQAVLANDQAIAASKPLILNMARNVESIGSVMQNGPGNLNGPAQPGQESAGSVLDTNRLERIIGALQHNIEIIKHELSDPTRFPTDPQSSSDRQAIRLKGLLQDVLQQQQALLNMYEGMLDSRQLGDLAGRGNPLQQLFQIDKPELAARGSLQPLSVQNRNDTSYQNPKTQGGNNELVNGELSPLPAQLYNPEFFEKNGLSGLEQSVYGRMFEAVDLEQNRIGWLESALALRIIITTRECSNKPAVERPH